MSDSLLNSDNLSFKKWIKGFFSIKNIAKAIVLGLLFMGVQFIAKAVWKQAAPAAASYASSVQGNKGTITQLTNQETTQVTHNHSPFEYGLLGWIFGSKDKIINEEGRSTPRSEVGKEEPQR